MDTYRILLFVHVTAALALLATVGGATIGRWLMADAESLEELLRPAECLRHVPTATKLLAAVLMATGLGLAYLRRSLTEPWVLAAVATLVWLAATGARVFQRRFNDAVAAATTAGAVTPDVTRPLHDPMLKRMSGLRVTLFGLLAFLMTVKPTGVGTAAAVATAIALGIAAPAALARRALARRALARRVPAP
jgi:hypothetical protein